MPIKNNIEKVLVVSPKLSVYRDIFRLFKSMYCNIGSRQTKHDIWNKAFVHEVQAMALVLKPLV